MARRCCRRWSGWAPQHAPHQRRIERDLAREATQARLRAELETALRGRRPAGGGAARADLCPLPERQRRRARLRRCCRRSARMQPANDALSMAELKDVSAGAVPAPPPGRGARRPRHSPAAARRREHARRAALDALRRCSARAAPCRRRACGASSGSKRCSASRAERAGAEEAGQCLTSRTAAARPHEQVRAADRRRQQACRRSSTAVAHPCDAVSLESAVEAARLGLIDADPGRAAGAHCRRRARRPGSISAPSTIVDAGAQPRFGGQGRRARHGRAGPKP